MCKAIGIVAFESEEYQLRNFSVSLLLRDDPIMCLRFRMSTRIYITLLYITFS